MACSGAIRHRRHGEAGHDMPGLGTAGMARHGIARQRTAKQRRRRMASQGNAWRGGASLRRLGSARRGVAGTSCEVPPALLGVLPNISTAPNRA